MRTSFLPFAPPDIGEDEIRDVVDVLRSGWLSTGAKVKRFEEEFAAYVGAPAALAVSSCTAALHLGLIVQGVTRGTSVVTTPLTFSSTVNVIEHLGALPLLADVAPDTLNIDPDRIEDALRRASPGAPVRAVLPVHLYGHPADLDAIDLIAERDGLAVVEDAAHALSARYGGVAIGGARRVGSLTAFSFYPTKNITTGEGGMLTGPRDLIERARPYALHGMSSGALTRYGSGGTWSYEVVAPGFKYNMTDIQAALGLRQLARLGAMQRRRSEIVARYRDAFRDLDTLELPAEREGVTGAWHVFVVRLRLEHLRIDRARFIQELAARNIGASVHFIPVHLHRYYREKYGFAPEDLPVALHAYERIVSLSTSPRHSDGDIDDVIEAVIDIDRRFHA